MNYPTDVCLVGATGLVGHELFLILSILDEIKSLKVVTRSPMGKVPPGTENILLNFDKMKDYAEELKASVYICCLGTTIKKAGSQEAFRKVDHDYVLEFARIAEKNKAQKFLVISAMGADPQSSVFYNRVKGEMEKTLKDMDIPQIEVFRPSLILGDRKEKRAGEEWAQKLSPYINPLLGGFLKKYRAIKATDIAKAMAIATLNFQPGFHIYESDQIQHIADQK